MIMYTKTNGRIWSIYRERSGNERHTQPFGWEPARAGSGGAYMKSRSLIPTSASISLIVR